jgi:uncharacterized DUF497 family protein
VPDFEFDSLKSVSNLWKHGISLADAQALWNDPARILIRTSAKHGESRFKITAIRQGKLWTCVFTLRQGCYRLISCRRAWEKEAFAYQLRGI